ncbi:MAG TPA: DUF1287 domain-containing protein [Alphaproteobacteria bacterium]|nr:DUF1287 domain-containing protein [Alphaproteobacteria bacterium]HAJ47755.1 DUF1287 domain-containing protein [Alphaproteobacteria bacterium]
MRDTTLPMAQRLSAAAMERTRHTVRYDPAYLRIPYPGGDVPAAQGVCSDEVIRAFRSLGIDLQERVHRDMVRNFGRYPKAWGLDRPDANIDHRRVPNLEVYFARHGQSLSVSSNPADYRPGDIVTWRLPGNLPHIGIVTELRSRDGQRPLIVHNIGAGPQLEDALFRYPLHRRFAYPARQS